MSERKKRSKRKKFLAVFKCPECNAVNDSQKTDGGTALCEICGCDSGVFEYRCPSCDALSSSPPLRSDGGMWCEACGHAREQPPATERTAPESPLNPPPGGGDTVSIGGGGQAGPTSEENRWRQANPSSAPSPDAKSEATAARGASQEGGGEMKAKVAELERELAEARRARDVHERDAGETITILERDLATFQARICQLSDDKEKLSSEAETLRASLIDASEAKIKYKDAFESMVAASPEPALAPKQSGGKGSVSRKPAAGAAASAVAPGRPPKQLLLLLALGCVATVLLLTWALHSTGRLCPTLECPPCAQSARKGDCATVEALVSQCRGREAALGKKLADAEGARSACIASRDACEAARSASEAIDLEARRETTSCKVQMNEAEERAERQEREWGGCEARLQEAKEAAAESKAREQQLRAEAREAKRQHAAPKARKSRAFPAPPSSTRGGVSPEQMQRMQVWARFM